MFSSAIQGHLVQSRVEELRLTAQRSDATLLSTQVRRMFSRVFAGGPTRSEEFAAIHGVQFVGHPAATRSQQS